MTQDESQICPRCSDILDQEFYGPCPRCVQTLREMKPAGKKLPINRYNPATNKVEPSLDYDAPKRYGE